MKRIPVLTTLTALVALWTTAVFAAVPQLINFQGILRDGSGNPVPNSTYSVTFRIYDAPTGGTLLYSETQSVGTVNGLFTVLLGSATVGGIPDAVLGDSSRYLGVTVSPDPEMTPRQKLASVAYGYRVNSVDGASGGTITNKVSIGPGHTNTGTNAFVAGENNTANGDYSTIDGGTVNTASGHGTAIGGGLYHVASGNEATIGGGQYNMARGEYSVVSGGGGPTAADSNAALGNYSTVGGGTMNTAGVQFATVGGGGNNRARGEFSVVAGGGGSFASDSNSALGDYSTIGGGRKNIASGDSATVSGGVLNKAAAASATVSGGRNNNATGNLTFIGGGVGNSAGSIYATVAGGALNDAAGSAAFIGGGFDNLAVGGNSTIGGGLNCVTNGDFAFVGGGYHNKASGHFSVVGGGGGFSPSDSNSALGTNSAIVGGSANLAGGNYSTVGGGRANLARGNFSVVAGGGGNDAADSNVALGVTSTVSGGRANKALGLESVIAGGTLNSTTGPSSAIGGGLANQANDTSATVSGGKNNNASGAYSTVPGGSLNTASGRFSFAAGRQAKAYTDGTFVWADNTVADFASTGDNQFLIRASGGVGIGTNAPSARLHLKGTGFQNSFGYFDTEAAGQNAGVAFLEAGVVKSYVYYEPGSNTLNLWREGLTGISITSTGSVGIGTTVPEATLHVHKGSAGAVTADGNSTGVFENSTHNFLSILRPASSDCGVLFGEPGSIADGGVVYDGANNRLDLRTNGNVTKMSITAGGSVGIGTAAPLDILQVIGDIRVGTAGTNGCVRRFDGVSIAGTCVSDKRLKKNVQPFEPLLDKLARLEPVRFDWRKEEYPKLNLPAVRDQGLIAQEVEKILPELVTTDENGFKAIQYHELPLLLLQAIKEQQKEIEELKKEMAKLKNQPPQAQVEN
ncbi:MAG: tail fiber domain-containing protein [candidate division Zixibacteria bacterium]|nr:tail fiber domain-containing protein [candidate division Zixibacteria bacterium]